MAKTRTTRRRLNQRPKNPKQPRQQYQQPKSKNVQSKTKSVPTFSKGVGVKKMNLSRRQRAKWKIKRLTPPPRHINVNNKGKLVRKMIVRRSAIYPDSTAGGTY